MTRTTWHPIGQDSEIKAIRYYDPVISMKIHGSMMLIKPKDAERLANALLKAAITAGSKSPSKIKYPRCLCCPDGVHYGTLLSQ